MVEELNALSNNGTWNLVDLPMVLCKLMVFDYLDTFAPVAKLISVKLFLSLVATYDWQLYQFDIKNVFLHCDLEEEVYMEQPPVFVARCSKGIWANEEESPLSSKIFVWVETEPTIMVWKV
ncbi:hypothetical protein LIER_24083 [Lithospermum erythrorhizon]|uniref:Reverse transcriptase Ty1/copia-type domain-containing protein n=1 Tax=Lithospermum erythrorhizon TaxID=34254 RepID=A0AAV3R022_LITER